MKLLKVRLKASIKYVIKKNRILPFSSSDLNVQVKMKYSNPPTIIINSIQKEVNKILFQIYF